MDRYSISIQIGFFKNVTKPFWETHGFPNPSYTENQTGFPTISSGKVKAFLLRQKNVTLPGIEPGFEP
jgi:hypothetical protein